MESYVRNVAESYFKDHQVKVFGAAAVFVKFVQNAEVRTVSMADLDYQFVVGRIVYRESAQGVVAYKNLLIRYFEATELEPGLLRGLIPLAREVHFLQTMLPNLDAWKPIKHLFLELRVSSAAGTQSSNQNAVVWQRPAWFTRFEKVSSLAFGYAHCSLMVRRIAEFHACSLHVQTVYNALYENLNFANPQPLFFDTEPLLPTLVRCLQPLYQDPRYWNQSHLYFRNGVARLERMLETFVDHLSVPFVRSSTGNRCWVLCHQHYGQHSVVFEQDETGAPVDLRIFNCLSTDFASLGVDLVVPLFVELDGLSRAQYFDTLVGEYYAELKQTGCHFLGPSLRYVAAEIKKSVPYALYILAGRIVRAQAELQPENSFFQSTTWKEDLITDLYKDLIVSQFV